MQPLLKLVLGRYFGNGTNSFVDHMVSNFTNSQKSIKSYVTKNLVVEEEAQILLREKLSKGDPNGPLCVHILKQYYDEVNSTFNSYGRVVSGTLSLGQSLRILGDEFTTQEQEDMVVSKAACLQIVQEGGRYGIEVDKVSAGNWVSISGIDQSIIKTATLFDARQDLDSLSIFKPVDFFTSSIIKVACEPLNPSELPQMLGGLKRVAKSYPLAQIKVEESGEHIIIATGELYMDSLFQDLRTMFSDIEIKISEPFVSITETVADSSQTKCACETPNKKNKISMMAQPLEKGLAEHISFLSGDFSNIQNTLVT